MKLQASKLTTLFWVSSVIFRVVRLTENWFLAESSATISVLRVTASAAAASGESVAALAMPVAAASSWTWASSMPCKAIAERSI